jgi:hypothetical protein
MPYDDIRGPEEFVRREHERSSVPLALAARVTDAVLSLVSADTGLDATRGSWFPEEMGYQCIVRRSSARGTIGYRVQIECHQPEYIAGLLRRVDASWIGIETTVTYGEAPHPLQGLSGKVGGILGPLIGPAGQVGPIGLTCSHVDEDLGPPFLDLYCGPPEGLTACPDIRCVQFPDAEAHETMFVRRASAQVTEQLMTHQIRVARTPQGPPPGLLLDFVETFDYLGRTNRFPSIRLHAQSVKILGLRWSRRDFSKPGDSGSWVVDLESRTWLGVVVAGRDMTGDCYAHRAGPLVELIERRCGDLDPNFGEERAILRGRRR